MANPGRVQTVNFDGFGPICDNYPISAAAIVPAGLRLVATSGHVGLTVDGVLVEGLVEQMRIAFENVEKSLHAAAPGLTKEELWQSVYSVTFYHVGGLGSDVVDSFFTVQKEFMSSHSPASTGIGVESLAFGQFEISVLAAVPQYPTID